MGEVIAILSGKGGTGKTSVCAGLGAALAEKPVLCVDCDAGLRNLDISLGISELDALSFWDICSGAYGLDMAAQHPLFENLRFLTAPVSQTWQNVEEKAFQKLLAKAKKKFKYTLLDCPTGFGRCFPAVAETADRVLLVTDSDPASIRGTARMAQELEKLGQSNVKLIVNRVDGRQLARRKLTVDDIMDETGVALLGIIPEDNSIPGAAVQGKPVSAITKKGAVSAFSRIAKRIQGISEPIKL